jgi:vitamin B12 transporter
VVGNPDLEPERTTSVEVGAAFEGPRAWLDVAVFRNDISDRIATVPVAPGSNRSMYQNRNESEVAGLEVQSRVELAELRPGTRLWAGVNGVYNFRMRDLDAAARNLNTDRIERMYESQATLSLGVTSEAWRAQVLGTYSGRIWYDTEENLLVPEAEPFRTFIHEKSPYWIWSLRGRRAIAGGVWVTAAVDNLFDANEHPLFIALNREPVLADVRFSNGGIGNSLPGRRARHLKYGLTPSPSGVWSSDTIIDEIW